MKFELEISLDNTSGSFQKVDLFADQQLEYDLDFYDSLDITKIKLPFYTTLKVPLTSVNQASNRFNFDPFNSATVDFPKQDFYFLVNIFGASTVQIAGILNVISFEYNSGEPFIEVELKDYLSKYIAESKNLLLGDIYTSTDYTNPQTMSNFLSVEGGVLGQNPDYTRPISFPYIDFCNDVDGKFGYAERQFIEYGPGMNRAGIAPVFSVPKFFESLAIKIGTTDFPLRADSKIFEIGAYAGTTGLTNFEPEKLHFVPPAQLLADKDTNTRNFFVRQAPAWSGTNKEMNYCEDSNFNPKIIHSDYFGNIETCGNYGTNPEGQPIFVAADWGGAKRMDFYPYDNTSGFDPDGVRGFFAPKVSFNASIGFNSGNASATLENMLFEIPLVQEDKMVYGINQDSTQTTMRWKIYIGIYQDSQMVKKIPLQESLNGPDIILDKNNIQNTVQGFSNKTHTNATYDFFVCTGDGDEGALLATGFSSSYRDTIQFEPQTVYFPTDQEIFINSGSQFSVNYFLEPFDGELDLNVASGFSDNGSHHRSNLYINNVPYSVDEFDKIITRIESYGQLDIKFNANADYLPYKLDDIVVVKNSINQTCPLSVTEIMSSILKRFDCGLFYEYDSSVPTHVLRIDPLSLVRSGGQDINNLLDDLKSVKITNGGDKVKNLEIKNANFGGYFDDINNDDVTIGSTLQELNNEGVVELKIDLNSSVYYKSVCGPINYNDFENSNLGAFSERQLGFTPNLFTQNKDIGLRFAFLDKPLYKTNLLVPRVVIRLYVNNPVWITAPTMKTESQIIFSNNQAGLGSNYIGGQHIFNGRLFSQNTAGWSLLFEKENRDTGEAYDDIFAVSEKILQSEKPRIEFDIVVPTSNLSNLNFFLQTLSATNFTPNAILVKSASGEVFEDSAYLTIEGILQ